MAERRILTNLTPDRKDEPTFCKVGVLVCGL